MVHDIWLLPLDKTWHYLFENLPRYTHAHTIAMSSLLTLQLETTLEITGKETLITRSTHL